MNSLSRFLNRFRRRTLLLGLAVLLLLVKAGLTAQENYQEKLATLETRQTTLLQYRNLTDNGDELRSRLARLQANREKQETHLFNGATEEEIISAMQLNLQALVSTVGLQSESVRPVQQRGGRGSEGDKEDSGLGEVVIKARLVGTLSEFLDLLAALEKSEKFFKIENFSLTPYKRAGLKITLDLRGYFVIMPTKPAEGAGEPKVQPVGG